MIFNHKCISLQVVESIAEFLQRPETVVVAAPLAIFAAAPPPLPTFVPQGLPTPQGITTNPLGGGSIGSGGAGASGGGILPASALAVRIGF